MAGALAQQSEDGFQYQLQPLLFPALPQDHRIIANSPAAISLNVRCAEGNGRNLYIGSSDGMIHHYVLRDEGSSNDPDQFELKASKQISSAGKPIDRILILYKIGLAAVLCESTLTFLHLPNLNSVPPNTLPSVKGVSTVVLDDAEVDNGAIDSQGFVSICVIKRRQAILAKVGGGRWNVVREVPIPAGCIIARRHGEALCLASASAYSLVNLSTGKVSPLELPISQSTDSPSASTRPCIASISASPGSALACEFLITSHSEEQTLGVFVQADGEPVGKLIEWESHPRAISVDHGNVVSLLRNDTLQVHDLDSMQRTQIIHLPDLLEPRLLSSGQSRLDIEAVSKEAECVTTSIDISSRQHISDEEDAPPFADFGATANDTSWRALALQGKDRTTTLLMTCKNAIQCLCDPNPLGEIVSLIRQERWQALETFAHQHRSTSSMVLRPVYSLLTFVHLLNMDFFAAASAFPRSEIDPRLLLRLFPRLWDVKDRAGLQVPVFLALQPLTDSWLPIEELIDRNLNWNYGKDHSAEDRENISQLRTTLLTRADSFIETVIGHSRPNADALLSTILDTALVRLYAQNRDREKLAMLLRGSHHCDVDSVAEEIKSLGLGGSLAEIYFADKKWTQAVELWVSLIDGDLPAEGELQRGVQDVIQVLDISEDPALQSRFAFWVVRHDVQAGVRLLTKGQQHLAGSTDGVGGTMAGSPDPEHLLKQLRSANATKAAEQFLEQIVLSSSVARNKKKKKKTRDDSPQYPRLHQELLDLLLTRVETALQDSTASEEWRLLTQDFKEGGYAEAYVGHLALQAGASDETIDRLKLIMLLQGSTFYDVSSAHKRVAAQPSLAYETAILLGKLGQDEDAIRLLALELRDAHSAEAYCSQGGMVLSPFTASQIASSLSPGSSDPGADSLPSTESESSNLDQYALLIEPCPTSTAARKDILLKTLLGVYMDSGPTLSPSPSFNPFLTPTAHLLNTQALHLTTLDVLPLVDSSWPLSTLCTFLTRNLRRDSEKRHRGSITRALALARSLEVAEEAWRMAREKGGVIQEEEEEEEEEGSSGDGQTDAREDRDGVADEARDSSIVFITEKPLDKGEKFQPHSSKEEDPYRRPSDRSVPGSKDGADVNAKVEKYQQGDIDRRRGEV